MTVEGADPWLLELAGSGNIAYWHTLGVRLVAIEEGHVRLALPMRPDLGTFRPDVMHGGAVASLIDAAAATATRTLRRRDEPAWRGLATTDMNVSFLEAATSDIEAEGRVLRAGRTIAFTSVDVRDANGTLVAVGRVTLAIRRGPER